MTGKRFDYTAYDDGTESIYDREKDEYYFDMQLSEIEELMNELAEENKQLKQYKDAVLNCDSSKIIRVNRNTGEVDLIDKEYSNES